MKNYYLYLDESGNFREHGDDPSIVAGWMRCRPMKDDDAKAFMRCVRNASPAYYRVRLPFHGKEDIQHHVSGVGAYVTELLETLVREDSSTRLVQFVNQKHISIIDEPTTYLHVFCDGILALVMELLEKTDEPFSLHIFAAQRQDDELRELKQQKKIDKHVKIAIPDVAYRMRIEERLQTLYAKLSSADQKRIQSISFEKGVAEEDWRLMIADAVCCGLRGGRSALTEDEKHRIDDKLPRMRYEVPEKGAWDTMRDCFRQRRYADAITLWYGTYDGVLGGSYRDAFEREINMYFEHGGESELAITCSILSETIRKLVHARLFEEADAFLARLEKELYPLLAGRIDLRKRSLLDRMQFDGHFYRLTTATHEGDAAVSEREIAACDSLLPRLPKTFETLDYYLRYKLRVIEHRKNTYAFETACRELDNLDKTMGELLDSLSLVDGLSDYTNGMTSTNLGRIRNSRSTTLLWRAIEHPEESSFVIQAENDSRSALAHFTSASDRARAYEQIAEAQSLRGMFSDAVTSLAEAFGAADAMPASCLKAVLTEGDKSAKTFGLMHYATVMMRALRASDTVGKDMMGAWNLYATELAPFLQDKDYPGPITLWHSATACALIGKKSQRDYVQQCYRAAIDACDIIPEGAKVPTPDTAAVALLAALERVVFVPNHQEQNLTELKERLTEFLAREDLPDGLRTCFVGWPAQIASLTKTNIALKKGELLALSDRVPIL